MKVLMQPSRLAIILLLGILPLSAAGQCCIPAVIETQPSHCTHPDQSNEPAPAACNAPDAAILERVPNVGQLDNLRVEILRWSIALGAHILHAPNEWMLFEDGNESGPPADLAFLHHSPLRI